jgi:hypothetical protein
MSQGTVHLINLHTNLYLHVNAESREDGACVTQWQLVKKPNFLWRFTKLDDSVYQIVADHSGKALDADWNGGDGGVIHQWSCHDGDNQKWRVFEVKRNVCGLVNIGTGKALDSPWDSTYNGGPVHQWEWHGGQNQQWLLMFPLVMPTTMIPLSRGRAEPRNRDGTCYSCAGSGRLRCNKCNGRTHITCFKCNGSGHVLYFPGASIASPGGPASPRAFPSYGGGRWNPRIGGPASNFRHQRGFGTSGSAYCNKCDGVGELPCRKCGAVGHLPCFKCAGTGTFRR